MTADPDEHDLSGAERGASPRDLLVPALGDWMKQADPRSKVVAISLKSRASIMLGGRSPDVAIYADTPAREFTTSSYYASELPAWLRDFVHERPATSYLGRVWRPHLTDDQFDAVGATADDMPYEGRYGFGDLEV